MRLKEAWADGGFFARAEELLVGEVVRDALPDSWSGSTRYPRSSNLRMNEPYTSRPIRTENDDHRRT